MFALSPIDLRPAPCSLSTTPLYTRGRLVTSLSSSRMPCARSALIPHRVRLISCLSSLILRLAAAPHCVSGEAAQEVRSDKFSVLSACLAGRYANSRQPCGELYTIVSPTVASTIVSIAQAHLPPYPRLTLVLVPLLLTQVCAVQTHARARARWSLSSSFYA